MSCLKLRNAIRAIGDLIFVCVAVCSLLVTDARAVDLTWMAKEQNCKQFIRKFQGELRGESGIRMLPDAEQKEAREALKTACAGAIGRCEFSFCELDGELPIVVNRPPERVDIGKLLAAGADGADAKAVEPDARNGRPIPTLPPDRRVPENGEKGAKAVAATVAAARERRPLYDPRQKRLLEEIDAEDQAENERKAKLKAADEQMKEALLQALGTPDAGGDITSNIELGSRNPEKLLETSDPEPQPTPAPTASAAEIAVPELPTLLPTALPTPEMLPPDEMPRAPTSPWSRAGTFPRRPISESDKPIFAPTPVPLTSEEIAKAMEVARRARLEWLNAELSCNDLLQQIKVRYSDVRPAGGFSAEIKLELWEVLNSACSPRFARCKFPQCTKLQKLTESSSARDAAELQSAAVEKAKLDAQVQSDLSSDVALVQAERERLIGEAQQREKAEKRGWQKVQMQSEILDRQRPEPTPAAEATGAETKKAPIDKSRYDPTVYADPTKLDRTPRQQKTGTPRTKQPDRPQTKGGKKAVGVPPPGNIF